MLFTIDMNTKRELYLKCNLCNESHEYRYSDSEYNAIEVEWISPKQEFQLLTTKPIVDENYLVNLTPPLTLKTDNFFLGSLSKSRLKFKRNRNSTGFKRY